MSEGFVVVSRWGPKQHQVGCTCGVCKSRRKEHAKGLKQKVAEQQEDLSSSTVLTPQAACGHVAVLASGRPSSADRRRAGPEAQPAKLNVSIDSEPDTANGIGTVPDGTATDRQQAVQRNKAGLKTRLNMELAALGTPDMLLTKVRVPRQAATAAKAAIKKDLLQQNSRPSAASVPPKAATLSALQAADRTRKATTVEPKKKQQPKGMRQRSTRLDREVNSPTADDSTLLAPPPAGPVMEPSPAAVSGAAIAPPTAIAASEATSPAAVRAAASLELVGSPHASAETCPESDKSRRSHRPDTAAAQAALHSPVLSDGSTVDIMGGIEQDLAEPPTSPPHPPQPPKAQSPMEQFAQEVRKKAKWGPAVDVNVRGLMASAALAGQPVHIQLKNKEPVYLQGVIQENGMVKCAQHVGGPQNHECSLSEFEKLGNSKERRPGENIHLTSYKLALKDFCALVNDIGEKARSRCLECKQGSGLIRCKGCSVAAHPLCVGLNSRQQQANWFCATCKASGQDKLPQRPQDLQGRARAPTHRPPPRPQPASAPPRPPHSPPSSAQPGKAQETSCVSPAGRVHMAVPVSGMTPARRERNGNKHKRLFMGGPGGLTHGEPVEYRTVQQGLLLKGEVHIKPGQDAMTGILCHCCHSVVSCSKFEAHAGQGSRRAPYDNIFTAEGITLRARAAMLPPLADGEVGFVSVRGPRRVSHSRSRGNAVDHSGHLGGIADGCRDVIHDLDHDAGGCNICGRPDFALGTFCDRTMILCDQCECEFHVGCLRKAARCDLSQLPTGDWFCSEDCSSIWRALNGRVSAGPTPLDPPDYTLQLMRGRDTSGSPAADATNAAIDTAQQVLQESFDPIIDKATKENLLLLMTKAEVKGEYDYRGMYTALLTHQGRAVCAAVFRAFGAQLAEVPLVATKADARRQGHCRILMAQFETILKEAGVRTLCLPAAHETVHTWIQGFGLQPMPDDDLDAACKDLRLLIFPGTQVLQKQLLPPLPAKQGPLMTPPWAEEAAPPPAAEGQLPAGLSISDQAGTDASSAVKQETGGGLRDLVTAAAASVQEVTAALSGTNAAAQADELAARTAAGVTEAQPALQLTASMLQTHATAPAIEHLTVIDQDAVMKPGEVAERQLPVLGLEHSSCMATEATAEPQPSSDALPGETAGSAHAAGHQMVADDPVDIVSVPVDHKYTHTEPQDMSVQAAAQTSGPSAGPQVRQPVQEQLLSSDQRQLSGRTEQQHHTGMPADLTREAPTLLLTDHHHPFTSVDTAVTQPVLHVAHMQAEQAPPVAAAAAAEACLSEAMQVDVPAQPSTAPTQAFMSADWTGQQPLGDTAAASSSQVVLHPHEAVGLNSAVRDKQAHDTGHAEDQDDFGIDMHLSDALDSHQAQSVQPSAEPPAGAMHRALAAGHLPSAPMANAELESSASQHWRAEAAQLDMYNSIGTGPIADSGSLEPGADVCLPGVDEFISAQEVAWRPAEQSAGHSHSSAGADGTPHTNGVAETNSRDWYLSEGATERRGKTQSEAGNMDMGQDVQHASECTTFWGGKPELSEQEETPSAEHVLLGQKRQLSPPEGADVEDAVHAKKPRFALSSYA